VGRPILLNMTSEDVIHAFFIPAFRLKQDVIPGQYTRLWFTATKPGVYDLFCAEFCGTLHSNMVGSVIAMEPADYEAWLRAGSVPESLAAAGERLFRTRGCAGCHVGGSVRAPMLEGMYGRPRPVQIPPPGLTGDALITAVAKIPATTMIADETYIHDSILLPEKWVAAGYLPVMPTYKNRLTEAEILRIVAYLKSLSATTGPNQGRTGADARGRTLSAEEYKARTGFVPENVSRRGGAVGGAGATRAPGSRGGASVPDPATSGTGLPSAESRLGTPETRPEPAIRGNR
jgi:mono/diheme cytochrome c family protein